MVSETFEISLEVLVYQQRERPLSDARLSCDVANALAFMHSRNVWHRALRAAACVVTADDRRVRTFAVAPIC